MQFLLKIVFIVGVIILAYWSFDAIQLYDEYLKLQKESLDCIRLTNEEGCPDKYNKFVEEVKFNPVFKFLQDTN